MEEPKTYKTIGEKFEDITKGQRQRPGMVWLQNPDMDTPGSGSHTLVEVPAKQFEKLNSPYRKQGYTQYKHVKAAPAPVEAKQTKPQVDKPAAKPPVAADKMEAQNIADGKAIAADIDNESK